MKPNSDLIDCMYLQASNNWTASSNSYLIYFAALLLGEEECPALPAHLSVLDDSEMSDASKGFGQFASFIMQL